MGVLCIGRDIMVIAMSESVCATGAAALCKTAAFVVRASAMVIAVAVLRAESRAWAIRQLLQSVPTLRAVRDA
eukprot:6195586-Pleurochrysis_carterae.AAC.1